MCVVIKKVLIDFKCSPFALHASATGLSNIICNRFHVLKLLHTLKELQYNSITKRDINCELEKFKKKKEFKECWKCVIHFGESDDKPVEDTDATYI